MRLGAIAVTVAATLAVVFPVVFSRESDARRAAGLVADSLEASRDRTRQLQIGVEVLGQGMQLLQRRSVQSEQKADSLDRALGLERKARIGLAGSVRPGEIHDTVTVYVSGGTLTVPVNSRKEPFTVTGEITVPPPPAKARVDLTVTMDTLDVELRLSCGARNAQGIRAATITARTPVWLNLDLRDLTQDAEVCNPRTSARGWRSSWKTLAGVRDRLGVYAGVAPTYEGGRLGAAPVVAAGVRVWP